MKLQLDISRCVRATSKFSVCNKCVDSVPESISMVDNLPSFANATGVEASACIGSCPTEAFSLSDFSTTQFFFNFLDSKIRLVSPKINVPCISVLSVEHLISLAITCEENVVLDMSSYDSNSILFELISQRIEEANFVLSSFSEKSLKTNFTASKKETSDTKEESSRRSFLGNISLKGAVRQKKVFDEAMIEDELTKFHFDVSVISKIKEKSIPDKRKILLTTLKRANVPNIFEILPQEELSFISQKFVDESCTNCQICYRICPTGSLSSNAKFSIINFDAMLCVKCHLCHDVCEPNSIQLQNGFEIKELFEPKQRTLVKFNIKRCNECGNPFTYKGGVLECPRCMAEEEEAAFLHNNAKVMRSENAQE